MVVTIFFVYEPDDLNLNYLAPSGNDRKMLQGDFVRYVDLNHIYLKTSKNGNQSLKVDVNDIMINEAPLGEKLQLNDEVVIPVKYKFFEDGNVTATCGTWDSKPEQPIAYVSGTVIREMNRTFFVKVDYVRK